MAQEWVVNGSWTSRRSTSISRGVSPAKEVGDFIGGADAGRAGIGVGIIAFPSAVRACSGVIIHQNPILHPTAVH
jgi:hypothetical protein